MKKLWKNYIFWEIIGYLILACCVVGQVNVGYWYLLAQAVYLAANGLGIIRDIALKLPKSNLVRDICFTAITIGLIIIRLFPIF